MKYIILMLLFVSMSFALNNILLLKNVESLTFNKGNYTRSGINPSRSELTCIGGNAINQSNMITSIKCKNMGWDGCDFNWICESDINQNYQLGYVDVVCETYNHYNDQYILDKSCYINYELNYEATKPDQYNEYFKPIMKLFESNSTLRLTTLELHSKFNMLLFDTKNFFSDTYSLVTSYLKSSLVPHLIISTH